MATLEDARTPEGLERIDKETDVDELLKRPLAIIYKHSTMCSVSSVAIREMEAYQASHPSPEHRVFRVDVIEDRPVSSYIESRTGVRHESPQVLVLRNGEVVWTASHFDVTSRALSDHLS